MKTLHTLLILISIFALSACKTGFDNFNQQKFTNLKTIKPIHQQQLHQDETVEVAELNPQKDAAFVPPLFSSVESIEIVDEVNPEQKKLILEAISNGTPIIIQKGNDYYRLDDAVYDRYYKAVIGKSKLIDENELPKRFLKISTTKMEERLGKSTVYLKEIDSVKMTTISQESPQHEKDLNEHDLNNNSTEEGARDSGLLPRKQIQKIKENKVIKTHNFVLATLVIGILSFIVALAIEWVFILAAIAILAGFIGRIVGVVQFRKYKLFSEKNAFSINDKVKLRRDLMLVGLIIQVLPIALSIIVAIAVISFF